MKKFSEPEELSTEIKPERNRFPFCIVWTPLPLITAVLPFIGHTGICTADGVIHDFAGPYTVSVDDMAFGNPTKYVQLDVDLSAAEKWDEALVQGDRRYRGMMHNLCCNNCHSHVACALTNFGYEGTEWNMVKVWWLLCTQSHYVGLEGFIKTYLGFVILLVVVLALVYVL